MELPGLIVARALIYGTMLPAAGLPLYWLIARQRVADLTRSARISVAALAALALLASLWGLLEAVAAMAAVPVGTLDRATVTAVAGATPLGISLELRFAGLALLAGAILARWPLAWAALAGTVALGSLALTGHAGAGEGLPGLLHTLGDAAHLVAAACWIGALLAFLAGSLAPEARRATITRLAAFASVGTVLVAVLVISGLANSLFVAGWPAPLQSAWTRLLLAKFALFAVMLGCASLNRWKLVPAVARHSPGAAGRLRLSLTVELAAGLAIVLLVAWLGTLDPAA